MNITGYYSKGDEKASIYRGRATLQKGYTVVDGNISFYKYVGSNSAKPFPRMVHPEDADCVYNALRHLDEGPQRLLFRLLCDEGDYRYMYGVFQYNGREEDGFRYVDVEFMDIMRIHYKFDEYNANMIKYRKFMSLSKELYFEYKFSTEQIVIYEYVKDRSVVWFRDTLSNLQKRVAESTEYTFKQKAEFESLQEYLANAVEYMDLELDGSIFGLDCGYMRINGSVMYLNNAKEMMAASITVTKEVKQNEKYYMSPHAIDNATGVYNKRAIKEIALELIANAGDNKVLLSVMDIDDFKNINDTFGHMTGDDIIARVAEIIRTALGNRGYVGRFGGDEFMVVTDKVKDAKEFAQIFGAIRKNITWKCGELLPNMDVTLSMGIVTYPDHASGYEEMFSIADKCLYIAKAKGKNRMINYVPEKHANYNMASEKAKKNVSMTYEQSCNAVVGIMDGLCNDSPEYFDKSVQEFLESYHIDRVIICAGEGYKTLRAVYNPSVPKDAQEALTDMAFWEKEDAAALFDQKGVLIRNRVLPLEDTNPEIYVKLSSQGTVNFIAVKVNPANEPKMLVFYDLIGRHRKWSASEEGLLHIAAWSIAQRCLNISEK